MQKNKYQFLEEYIGLHINIHLGVDVYGVLAENFLQKFGSKEVEEDRVEASRLAYRVMRGLNDNGFDYNFILQNGKFLEVKEGLILELGLKNGVMEAVQL